MEFERDDAKHARNLRERGIGFDDGARIFDGTVLIWEDKRREYSEDRFRAVGESAGDVLHVAFTWRGDLIRINSVRRAVLKRPPSHRNRGDQGPTWKPWMSQRPPRLTSRILMVAAPFS